MGNKRNRRSRRLETPSPSREENVETPNPGNMTLTNSNLVDQENLGPSILENQLTEPSLISNEIQVWTQEMEKRNNDKIGKMREEIYNKFEAILKEIKTSKNASTITNPRSETNETQNTQPSGSRDRSIGVHASVNDNSDSENEDSHPIRASNMHELRNPAKPFCQNRFELNETMVSNEDSEEEDYHSPGSRYPIFEEELENCGINEKLLEMSILIDYHVIIAHLQIYGNAGSARSLCWYF